MRLFLISLLAPVLFGCSSLTPEKPLAFAHKLDRTNAVGLEKSDEQLERWSSSFGDPGVAKTIAYVLSQNLDFSQARLRVEQSRFFAAQAQSRMYPRGIAGADASRNRSSENERPVVQSSANSMTNRYAMDVIASWELDLFGRLRQAARAADRRAEASIWDAEAMRLTLGVEAARRAIDIRALQAHTQLAMEAVELESDFLAVVEARQRGGLVSQVDVLRARAQLEASLAGLERLNSSLVDSFQALAILASTSTDNARALIGQGGLPEAVGLQTFASTSSDVLRRRPDVRAAEARLGAASADLASAVAERFPRINLLASVGLVASGLGGLTQASAPFSSVSSSLRWSIFDGGELESLIESRRVSEKIALLAFNQALISAFADSDAALQRVAARESELRVTRAAAATQLEAWRLAKLQYEKGGGDLTIALEARRLVNSIERDRLNSQQALLIAMIESFRAIGSVESLPKNGG
jgi:NodT family efflux transporter outer membrane factor (OMF) lipoprotein